MLSLFDKFLIIAYVAPFFMGYVLWMYMQTKKEEEGK